MFVNISQDTHLSTSLSPRYGNPSVNCDGGDGTCSKIFIGFIIIKYIPKEMLNG